MRVQRRQDRGKSAHRRGMLRAGGSGVKQRGARHRQAEEGHKETSGAIGWKRGARREPSNGKLQSCHQAEVGA